MCHAGLMAEKGLEVWAVDIWEEHITAINSTGLRLRVSGNRVIKGIHGVTALAEVPACDVYIIATKADGVASAAAVASHIADALVRLFRMGWSRERIAQHMPTTNVSGVAEGLASLKGAGHAHHNNMRRSYW